MSGRQPVSNEPVASSPPSSQTAAANRQNLDTPGALRIVLVGSVFSSFVILIVVVFLVWHYHRRARELRALYTVYHNSASGNYNSTSPSVRSPQVPVEAPRRVPDVTIVTNQDRPFVPLAVDILAQTSPSSSEMTGDTSSSSLASPFSSPFPGHEFLMATPFLDRRDGRRHPAIDFHQPPEHHSNCTSRGIESPFCENQASSRAVGTSSSNAELDYDIRLMDLELRDLGMGASGRVKEAIYVTQDKQVHHVAVKYAHDSSRLFRDELEIISKLSPHENIVKYYGGRFSGQASGEELYEVENFIVMELMFTNLEDIIHGDIFAEGISCRLILDISLNIIKGLGHLHANGIIHYDLKPSNVLLDEDFIAKLADFGSSKKRLRSQTTASLRGTMGYIAPEVLLGHFCHRLKVSEKLDIYSMGVVMWEMVTGQHPPNPHHSYSSSFQDSFTWSREVVPRVLSCSSFQNASIERCPPPLRTLIEDCLNIEPEQRPTTTEIKDRLLEMQLTLHGDV